MTQYPTAKEADVALLLEGTYPFIRGGVSSWVDQIIRGMPDITFAIIFLGSMPSEYKEGMRYSLPKNVVHLEVHHLFQNDEPIQAISCRGNKQAFKQSACFHEALRVGETDTIVDAVSHLEFYLNPNVGIDEKQFYFSQESWQYISDMYEKNCTDPSFVDYFWTVRNLHRPIWLLAKIVKNAPNAKVFHSVSTGYAGFLGALFHHYTKKPYIITEHGLYTKERRIDLFQNQWSDSHKKGSDDPSQLSYQKKLWIRFFESLAHMSYAVASPIISLFGGYQQQQIEDGAKQDRTRIIPNGVDFESLATLIQQRKEGMPPVMCLLGRVVPIKDVKTFIRSVSVVASLMPTVQAWIVGPDDENLEYAEECRNLVISMNCSDKIFFKGMQKIHDIFPHVSVLVLSSISEGLPLVILESFSAGVPVVATNVGACSELIYGRDPEDIALGPAGSIVNISDSQALGNAVYELLSNQKKWKQAQTSALARVRKYYDIKMMLNDYRDLYQTFLWAEK